MALGFYVDKDNPLCSSSSQGGMMDFNALIKHCNFLLDHDETLMALKALDMVPGYWRDNYPGELLELKKEIRSKIATASFYATHRGCELEMENSHLAAKNTLRGRILLKELERLNQASLTPHIIDLGPGEFWLPKMCKNYKFTYEPIYVNQPTYEKYLPDFKEFLKTNDANDVKILFACEIIEHLHDESEIASEMHRHGQCDIIHLSTPRYSHNPGPWRDKGDMGHLRTYTPREFFDKASKFFPDYDLVFYDADILHVRGVWRGTKVKEIQSTSKVDLLL